MFTSTRAALGIPPFALFMIRTKAAPELAGCKTMKGGALRGKMMGKMYRAQTPAQKAELFKAAAKMPTFARRLAKPKHTAFAKFQKANLKLTKGMSHGDVRKAQQVVIRKFNATNKLPQLTIQGKNGSARFGGG